MSACFKLCDGEVLSSSEYDESIAAMRNLHVGNGYPCARADPFLLWTAAKYNIDIIHDFIGPPVEITVRSPRRVVYLKSSRTHMSHIRNVDLVERTKAPFISSTKSKKKTHYENEVEDIVEGTVITSVKKSKRAVKREQRAKNRLVTRGTNKTR